MTLDQMYQEEIMDRYRNPSNKGVIEKADIYVKEYNSFCGDLIEMYLKLNPDGKISGVKFNGNGCAISQAAADMLADEIKGKSLGYAGSIDEGKMKEMLGIPLGPIRIKCALLALKALKIGVQRYIVKK
ncbi:MAG: iron-sulfur cluster assembly scaffold protein [Candidatus Aenigmarchaeota archaeon]|nr:iron-sulfur cluster assembly scaffold protein [Candidatus Aenigmarchaeota archaeon]